MRRPKNIPPSNVASTSVARSETIPDSPKPQGLLGWKSRPDRAVDQKSIKKVPDTFSSSCPGPIPAVSLRLEVQRGHGFPSAGFSGPAVASQSRAVLSQLPVRTRLPSGLNATLLIPPVCPLSAAFSCPASASQIRAVMS